MATVTGDGHILLTADEGDADDREENRDTKTKNTIHSKLLQQKTGTYHANQFAVFFPHPALRRQNIRERKRLAFVQSLPARNPDVSLYRLHILHVSAQARMDKLALRVVLSRIKRPDWM